MAADTVIAQAGRPGVVAPGREQPDAELPVGRSRRRDPGAKTARGLLFTVLGEFVLQSGGAAWTSAFIDVLGRLGIEEKASRQALMRTSADGWLTPERNGRRTCWRLTSSAEQLLTEGANRIYGFTATRPAWNGRWLLVLARAPETERPARHLLRTRLRWAGLGSPAPGVWLSPDTGRAAAAESVLAEAGLLADSQIFLAEHAGGELAAMARQSWDLDQIEQGYEEFLAEFSRPALAGPASAEPGPGSGGPASASAGHANPAADPLATLTALVHAWRRFPWIDPVLPAELLPDGWSGSRAAALFARERSRLAPAAMSQWRGLVLDAG
jgi:phenylacetic acid degradation operon negative regulatory protein